MLAKSFEIITGFLGTAIRSFFWVLTLLECIWGLSLAALSFWIASQGSTVRGLIAAFLAVVLVTLCAVLISVYYSCLAVVRKAVADAGLGRSIFDGLFNYALGVAGEDTGQQKPDARVTTHMSREQVEQVLNDGAKRILTDQMVSSRWFGSFFWLAKKIQKISVWATVKVIVSACSHDGNSVNMFELRDRLAASIDQGVVNYINQYFSKLSFTTITIASLLAVMLAWCVGKIPI